MNERLPLFDPGSVLWRVDKDLAVGLAAPRAVLMQIAHPLVAAGVAEHSAFRTHRFARLYRTAMAATAITFRSRRTALGAIAGINAKHRAVRGTLKESQGAFPAGTPYSADDPVLKLWVLATITDTALLAYETLVAPLSVTDKERYYADSLLAAKLFGIPSAMVPATYADFCDYMASMLAGDSIQVSRQAMEVRNALFASTPSGLALLAGSAVGIALLPRRLRWEFNLDWPIRARFRRLPAWSRAVRRFTPAWTCSNPAATLAEFTLRWSQVPAASGARPHV